MTTQQVIFIARKHVNKGSMVSSAKLCLSDAETLYSSGDYDHARQRAIRSLEYSVGCHHADYQKVIGLR